MCKVFIRLELGVDFRFCVSGKVLILLGFAVVDVGKVFIANKKSPGGVSLGGSLSFFSPDLSIEDLG